jgi:hypothetical protein
MSCSSPVQRIGETGSGFFGFDKVDNDFASSLIDMIHKLHLICALRVVGLVDAVCISPYRYFYPKTPQTLERQF